MRVNDTMMTTQERVFAAYYIQQSVTEHQHMKQRILKM